MYVIALNNDYLVHHGILGQKWGVRRYQNYDGTYTKAGLARYNKSAENLNKAKEMYTRGLISSDDLALAKKAERDSYKNLKLANRADKGKKLKKRGFTEKQTKEAAIYSPFVGALGVGAAYYSGKSFFADRNIAGVRLSEILMGLNAGGAVASTVLNGKRYVNIKESRLYKDTNIKDLNNEVSKMLNRKDSK